VIITEGLVLKLIFLDNSVGITILIPTDFNIQLIKSQILSPNIFHLSDDLDIAADFFDYFLATRPLLETDPSLFCVSAWNDNGKPGLIDPNGTAELHRTDFFPGLGWMMTRFLNCSQTSLSK
jgi:hypothetical protein